MYLVLKFIMFIRNEIDKICKNHEIDKICKVINLI